MLYEGNELVRLNAATGRPIWSRGLGLDDLSERPGAFAMDTDRFFCASGATLTAYSLKDGQPSWSRPLVGPRNVGWSVALSEGHVAAYPNPGSTSDGSLDDLALVVYRKDSGRLVQRLAFPANVTELVVRLAPKGATVATQAGAWSLGGP